MNVLTYTEVRASFKKAMDDVCLYHEPTVITRQRGEHVVMMSLDDYNSMQETVYLLSNPKNAQRLMESVAQIKAGVVNFREIPTIELKTESEK